MASFDYKFVSKPGDALNCLICLGVAKDPQQHVRCGKLFCNECIEKHGRDKPCPNCQIKGAPFYPDIKSKRDIQALPVKCENVDRKCKWIGTVDTLEKHVSTCKFTPLPCPKQCKEGTNFMRKDLDEHLAKDCPNREYSCKYCGEKGTYANIIKIHDGICECKILPCPNDKCTKNMQRKAIHEHVKNVCEFTEISCKYESIGCEVKMQRKGMVAHEEDDKLHLHMALDTTVKLQCTVVNLQSAMEAISGKKSITENEEKSQIVIHKLVRYQEHKDSSRALWFPSYYVSSKGYFICLQVHANGFSTAKGTHVSPFIHFMKGLHDAELNWPFVGDITITLLNQLEDKNHHSRVLTISPELCLFPGGNKGKPRFISHSELGHDPIMNTQYLKNDTLYFRVSLDYL